MEWGGGRDIYANVGRSKKYIDETSHHSSDGKITPYAMKREGSLS